MFATGIPNGSEVRRIGTTAPDEALATVLSDGVAVYRSPDSMSLASALDNEIVAIGINGEYDGTTRFATIDDPALIARLVDRSSSCRRQGLRIHSGTARASAFPALYPQLFAVI